MKVYRIMIVCMLLMTLKSFGASTISNTEKTELITKMKDDKDVFSLLFKTKLYAIMVSTMNHEEISQETRENIIKIKKELLEHKVKIDSKFPKYKESNNATKREIIEKLLKVNRARLRATAECFAVGITGDLAACGGPKLTGWLLTKWNWCMGTVIVLDLVTAATNIEEFEVILEQGDLQYIVRQELKFCGRVAVQANYNWETVMTCTIATAWGSTTTCILKAWKLFE